MNGVRSRLPRFQISALLKDLFYRLNSCIEDLFYRNVHEHWRLSLLRLLSHTGKSTDHCLCCSKLTTNSNFQIIQSNLLNLFILISYAYLLCSYAYLLCLSLMLISYALVLLCNILCLNLLNLLNHLMTIYRSLNTATLFKNGIIKMQMRLFTP